MTTPHSSRLSERKAARARQSRRRLVLAAALTAAAVVVALVAPSLPATAAPAPSPRATVVSLTFDDGNADQAIAAAALKAAALPGTFYIIPGVTGAPDYLTLAQLRAIAADGNEIGGHTVNHPDLTLLAADEVARQVCGARNTLTDWGFPQRSFAYPYAEVNAAVAASVRDCGYASGRGLGDLRSQAGCPDCSYAGTIPPADPFVLAALDQVDDTWTLADLQQSVLNAESTGGWVIFTFHHVCDGAACDPLSVSPATLSAFTTWLADRAVTRPTTSVKTVGDVIGGAVRPTVTPPAPPATAGSLANASFESVGAAGPECFTAYPWGVNDAEVATTNDAHVGARAVTMSMTTHTTGAVSLLPTFDAGGCTPAATPGHTYTVGSWYKSSTPVQFVAYFRDAQGGFQYWTSGPYLPSSTTWTRATWTTPPLPTGASGISAGLSLFAAGSVTIDDVSFADSATLPPEVPATALGNASLEEPGINGMPQCWTPSVYGENDATFAATAPGHSGGTAVTVTIGDYGSGAAQLLPTMYGSTCAPSATAGTAYRLQSWYRSTTITQFSAYYLAADGVWTYWTASPWLDAATDWTRASWVTPALPAGATRVAFGLSLFGAGSLTTDDYGFDPDGEPDPDPATDPDPDPDPTTQPPSPGGPTPTTGTDSPAPPATGSGSTTPGTESAASTPGTGSRPPLPSRIGGANRYATAASLALEFGAARSVVVANGSTAKQGFDALSANYLAGSVGAPILLTAATMLPAETSAALRRLMQGTTARPLTVYVMGGADSVSTGVVAQINAIVQSIAGDRANHVVRVAGASRYDTAVAAAARAHPALASPTPGARPTGRTVFLASGTSNADALAAGPVSALLGIPVLLTPVDRLPASVAAALRSTGVTTVIVLGGTDRVSDAVIAQVKAAGAGTVTRIAGSDRHDTAARLQSFARTSLRGPTGALYGAAGSSPVFLANGATGFADALAVGPVAARYEAALLTVNQDAVPVSVAAFLSRFRGALGSVVSLGSTTTVSDAASRAAAAALG